MTLEQPDFDTASDDDLKRYLRDCWTWADHSKIEETERELVKRGHKGYVDYMRDLSSK